jgi:hypothetical protein
LKRHRGGMLLPPLSMRQPHFFRRAVISTFVDRSTGSFRHGLLPESVTSVNPRFSSLIGHQNRERSGTIVANSICVEKRRKVVDLVNIEILFLASLFLIGTTLLARLAVRRIERVPLATAAEYKYSLNGIRAGKKLRPTSID